MVLVNRNVAPSFNTIIEILLNDQRKIKLIRKYENTRKKIINNECAILFNKTCINESLLPKYSDIGHDRATHAQTAQFRMDTVANQLSKATQATWNYCANVGTTSYTWDHVGYLVTNMVPILGR